MPGVAPVRKRFGPGHSGGRKLDLRLEKRLELPGGKRFRDFRLAESNPGGPGLRRDEWLVQLDQCLEFL